MFDNFDRAGEAQAERGDGRVKHRGHVIASAIMFFTAGGLMIGSAFADYAPTFWLGVGLLAIEVVHAYYVVGLVQEDAAARRGTGA